MLAGLHTVVSNRPIMPVTATLSGASYNGEEMISYLRKQVPDLTVVDTEKACREIGSPKVMNVLLLGAALHSGALGLSEKELKDAIRERVPEKFHQMNFRALDYTK